MLGLPELTPEPRTPAPRAPAPGAHVAIRSTTASRSTSAPGRRNNSAGSSRRSSTRPCAQKLILSPIEGSPKECFKVLIKLDGSEYLLLENRKQTGFDESLPAEGLLIWRVVNNKPTLEESHGVEGPSGPSVLVNAVPYPSSANDSFTPHTTPSSQLATGRRFAGVPHEHSPVARWTHHVPHRL